MSSATFTQPRSYFVDVSNAARAFFAALFAAQERQFVAQEVMRPATAEVTPRAKEKSRRKLFAMADQYQDYAPNLSAELRFLASRG